MATKNSKPSASKKSTKKDEKVKISTEEIQAVEERNAQEEQVKKEQQAPKMTSEEKKPAEEQPVVEEKKQYTPKSEKSKLILSLLEDGLTKAETVRQVEEAGFKCHYSEVHNIAMRSGLNVPAANRKKTKESILAEQKEKLTEAEYNKLVEVVEKEYKRGEKSKAIRELKLKFDLSAGEIAKLFGAYYSQVEQALMRIEKQPVS